MNMQKKLIIAVGSLRVPKLKAVERAVKHVPNLKTTKVEVHGYAIKSGVANMPTSKREMVLGAYNRAWNLMKQGVKADFYVGMEGGIALEKFKKRSFWVLQGWTYITDGKKEVFAGGNGVELPQHVVDMVLKDGLEIGEAFDRIQKKKDVRSKNGAIGEITWNAMKRDDAFYFMAVACFAKFFNAIYMGKHTPPLRGTPLKRGRFQS